MRRFALSLAALFACGCGPASVTGTVGGNPIDSQDAVAELSTGIVDTLHVVIGGSSSDLCQDLSQGVLHQGQSLLQLDIVVGQIADSSYAIGVGSNGIVSAEASKLDTACGDILKRGASGGTITLTKIAGSDIEGSFDLTFDGGDHLTGSFQAPLCANTAVDLKTCQ